MNMRQCDSTSLQNARKMWFWRNSQYSILGREQSSSFNTYTPYSLMVGTNARPNMESRRFGINICFRANFGQLTGQLTLKLSVI